MDYEQGESLDEYLGRLGRALTYVELEALFNPLLDGLRAIHERNLLHLDIKPSNIFLRSDSTPVLIDFGGARHQLGQSSRLVSFLVASDGYSPSEQYTGRQLQPATDIYAVGATLYHCLTLRAPTDALTRSNALLDGKADPLAPVREVIKPGYPAGFVQGVEGALRMRLGERPQTVKEFQGQLFNVGESRKPDPDPQPHWKAAMLGGVVGSVLVGVLMYWQGQTSPREPNGPAETRPAVAASPAVPVVAPALPAPAVSATPTPVPTPAAPVRQPYEPALVRIKAGCFQMGSPANELEHSDDERQHEVCIGSDYEIGQYEVTQGEWEAVMGSNPSQFKNGATYPVEQVSWNDIQAYLAKLNAKTGKGYRLPSEAEWEYAARAGTTTPFWTGRCITTAQANYDGNYGYGDPDCGAKTGTDLQRTQPVGTYPANAWGLYDTAGNVWEWTCSKYTQDYDGSEQKCSKNDTVGPFALRGGSWFNIPAGVRSASRSWDAPTDRYGTVGFRLARSL